MDKQLKYHIHQLRGKTFPGEVYWFFARRLAECYEPLKEIILNEDAPDIQRSNAISVLGQVLINSKFDRRQEMLGILMSGCSSKSEKIRSVSSSILAHMASLVGTNKNINYNVSINGVGDVVEFLELALDLGISETSANYVSYVLKKE